MLAMDVNDDAGCLTPRGVLAPIASRLAPTGGIATNMIFVFPGIETAAITIIKAIR
jgi:hypothetical protein